MKLREKIINQAVDIDFGKRFNILRDTHSNMFASMSNIDVQKITDLIESYGYETKYNKSHKFFKIYNKNEQFNSLHLSLTDGTAEFILNLESGGEKYGDTYPRIAIDSGYEGDFRNPYFTDQDELKSILDEGFLLFEQLKSVIKE